MKLVIFGLTVSSSWGNGHATLWRGLIRALVARRHEVVFLERDVSYYAGHRDLFAIDGGELVLYSQWEDVAAPGGVARRHLDDADVGMVTSYCPDGPAAAALVLDSRVAVKSFYDLDTPVTLDRVRAGEAVGYLPAEGLGGFDIVLSYTGGRALEELQTMLGARVTAPLYGSVDPTVHRNVAQMDHYRSDLSYLGTYAADRQAALERFFIEPARRMSGKKFVIGGAQYPVDFPWTGNIHFVRHLPPAEHPAFFSSSRMTLNITRKAMADYGYCPSGRLFEAAACGCPLMSDAWEGLEAFFEPGREIAVVRETSEAVAALEMSDEELTRMARAARERVLAEHTAEKRAQEMVGLLAGASKQASASLPAAGELLHPQRGALVEN